MNGNEQFLGTVREKKFYIFVPQRFSSGPVRLTGIRMNAAQPPESDEINLSTYEGKVILVSGHDGGDWIYLARVVEESGPMISDFLIRQLAGEETKKLCALVIGHKKNSPGAVNENSRLSEFEFNEDLALRIEQKVKKAKVQRIYRRTYQTLPDDTNAFDPGFIVSLHCNAFNRQASGTEVLYYHSSQKGMKMAEILLKNLVAHMGLTDRGIKPKTAEDRGGYLLRYTNAPCVIAEPFFIDNDQDLARAKEDMDGLAAVYADAIDKITEIL